MKKRRKTDRCLNCQSDLDLSYNYCPVCGQENNDRQISFGKLINDFFSNYFSLDSRFGRSLKPFFFQPGLLTREYMIGRRVTYADPIRLYLVISLIHFFVLSLYTNSKIDDVEDQQAVINFDKNSSLEKPPAVDFYKAPEDSARMEVPDTTTTADDTTFWLVNQDWVTIKQMTADDYSPKEISDSLKLEKRPFMEKYVAKQAIKLLNASQASIRTTILENIPILMFLLLPVYALLLKLFFRKKLYINHLVHSLHIHSFVFLVLTLYWLISFFVTDMPVLINTLLLILLTLYVIASFYNTYATTKWRATYKVFLSGWLYCILMIFALTAEMIVSLLTL